MNAEKPYHTFLYHHSVLLGTALGILIMLASWIISIFAHDLHFTFSGIAKMHQLNPVTWVVDLFPVVIFFLLRFEYQKRKANDEFYQQAIRKKDISINKNAHFAQKIGEGDYDVQLELDESDDLGKSLLIMRDNLKANKQKETEENWIARGRDLISGILRIHNNIDELAYEVLVEIINYVNVIQGAFYIYNEDENKLVNLATFAYNRKKYINQEYKIGYGLIGECAYEMDIIYRTEIPEDYVTITSGILGDKKPGSLLIVPLIADEKLQGVMEFAAVEDYMSDRTIRFLKELGEIIARTVYNLRVNEKTENLLQESQQMTQELRENEEELRQNAEEMRSTQEELKKSNEKLEAQVREVENAQKRLYSLLENASEVIFIYDENLKLTYISPSVQKIMGYTPEEMMKGKDMDRLTRKGETEIRKMFDQLLQTPDEPQKLQYTYMRKDGKKIYLETIGRNLLHNPAIAGIILNSQDVTARKRAEKEERMKTKMQALSENSTDMIMRLNPVGQFFYANPVVKDYLGYEPKQLINKTLKQIELSDALMDYFEETINEIKYNLHKITKEITIPSEIGERIMSIDAIPEFNESELETILFVNHDITEAKRIEREIQEKNRKITESINYAQRIQSSILPTAQMLREELPNSFILYKARDVVSGDFPWMFKKGDNLYLAAVDCTGHGVPGALLSFIGYFSLNNVVDHDEELNAGQICDRLHYSVRKTLRQDRVDADARDGMDIAFCKINLKNNALQYAGAHRPLYLLRNNELIDYKGDRKAIGGIPHRKKVEKEFTNYTIDIKKGDKIFFFSDGLPDQIGGPSKMKYSPKRVRELIKENHGISMKNYSKLFSDDFNKWKGNNKQLDDVLLIGIEF